MWSIEALAAMLLAFRITSMVFIVLVLLKQLRLMKIPIVKEFDTPTIRRMRKVFFIIALVIFLGNFIPIAIDVLTLFVETGRPARVQLISIGYAFSNSLVAMLSSIFIYALYWLADYTGRGLEDD